MPSALASPAVDLFWIPLGAGGHVVHWNGKIYEAIKAFVQHRPRSALYHTALEVSVPGGRFVIESAPIPSQPGRERGVVAEGPVGTRSAGRFRLFRYEIRRWRGGSIPDANEAVGARSALRPTSFAQSSFDLPHAFPRESCFPHDARTGGRGVIQPPSLRASRRSGADSSV